MKHGWKPSTRLPNPPPTRRWQHWCSRPSRTVPAVYPPFVVNAPKQDPQYFAKRAIVRALVTLDAHDADFFLAGMRYRQLEPGWHGKTDTALDVPVGSAMGLVGSGGHRAAAALAELLNDPELVEHAALALGAPRDSDALAASTHDHRTGVSPATTGSSWQTASGDLANRSLVQKGA